MSRSTAFAFNRLSEAINSTKIVIGNLFIPVVAFGANLLQNFALSVKDFAQSHQTIAKVLAFTVGVFGALAAGAAAFAAAAGFFLKSISLGIEGLKLFTSVGKVFFSVIRAGIPILRLFAATLISNPLLLAATAVAALGFLIYKNWDKVKGVISTLWKAFKGFAGGIGELIKKASHIGSSVLLAFKGLAGGIGLLLSKAVKAGKSTFVSLAKAVLFYSPFGILVREWQKVFGLLSSINLFKAGSKIISTLIEGVKSKAKELYNAVKGTLSKVRNLLPFSPAKEGPLSDLHKTGLRLVETIAQSLKGDPLVKKVSSVLASVKSLFLSPLPFKLHVPLPSLSTLVQKVKLLTENQELSLPAKLLKIAAFSLPVAALPLQAPPLKFPVEKPLSLTHLTEKKAFASATYHIHLNITVNGKADRQTALEIARAVEPVVRKILKEQQRKEARINYGIGDLYDKP
jgi:hypothetical protein